MCATAPQGRARWSVRRAGLSPVMHFQRLWARRAALFAGRAPAATAEYAKNPSSHALHESASGRELTRILQRYRQYLNERKQVAFAMSFAVGCGCVMWLLTSRKTVRGQVSVEVAGMAVEILAAEPLQQRVMSVANSLMIERLSDPGTVAAAASMTVRVLDQQHTEDATRGVLFNMLSDSRAENQVTELFVRVGGKAGTKDAVVTVFRNTFVDDSARTIGAEYLRRVLVSPPVLGTCGGTAAEQFRLVLNDQGTTQSTNELVASVLETESVQRHAADFVWASLVGADRASRKTSRAQSKQVDAHSSPTDTSIELTANTSAAERVATDSNRAISNEAVEGDAADDVAVGGARRVNLVARVDEAERLLATLLAARVDRAERLLSSRYLATATSSTRSETTTNGPLWRTTG